MNPRMLRRFITALALSLISVVVAMGQSSQTYPQSATWKGAGALIPAHHKIYVVTTADPKRRHACEVQSFGPYEIVCTHLGHKTAYQVEDVAALIDPGEHTAWYLYFAAFLAGSGAAVWGTVVLAAVCPPCAAGTVVAAVVLFVMAGGSGMLTDGDYDGSLLYLAPGQKLQVKLG